MNTDYISIISGLGMIIIFSASVKTDFQHREIPNYISYSLIPLGLLAAYSPSINTYEYLISGLLIGFVSYLIGYALYRMNSIGGGDVKLWSFGAFAFGTSSIDFLFWMLVLGGGLALFVIFAKRRVEVLGQPPVWSDEAEMPENIIHNLGCPEMPYGLAIAASGILFSVEKIIGV